MEFVLSQEAAMKVGELIGQSPALPRPETPYAYDAPVFIKVSSFTSGSGAGSVVDLVGGAWTAVSGTSTVTVQSPNAEALTVNNVYRCTFHGYDATNNRAIYITSGGQGGITTTTITVVTGVSCSGGVLTVTTASVKVVA